MLKITPLAKQPTSLLDDDTHDAAKVTKKETKIKPPLSFLPHHILFSLPVPFFGFSFFFLFSLLSNNNPTHIVFFQVYDAKIPMKILHISKFYLLHDGRFPTTHNVHKVPTSLHTAQFYICHCHHYPWSFHS